VTLQQAIQHAVENYPAIQASAARVSAQESDVDLARTAQSRSTRTAPVDIGCTSRR
jgi:hypothetical protein